MLLASKSRPAAPSNKKVDGFTYDGVRAGRNIRAGLSRQAGFTQPLPLEDVAFFVKRIDNDEVEYRCDPADKRSLLGFVSLGLAAALILLIGYGPRAWIRQSGYRTAELNRQVKELTMVQRQLTVRRGQLAHPQRVKELAAQQGFVEPSPEDYFWQDRTVPPANPGNALAQLLTEGD